MQQAAPLPRSAGFQMRAASAAAIHGREPWQEWLYTVDWQPRPYFGLPPEFLPAP
jgi:hypothetical protein